MLLYSQVPINLKVGVALLIEKEKGKRLFLFLIEFVGTFLVICLIVCLGGLKNSILILLDWGLLCCREYYHFLSNLRVWWGVFKMDKDKSPGIPFIF